MFVGFVFFRGMGGGGEEAADFVLALSVKGNYSTHIHKNTCKKLIVNILYL